MRFVSAIWVATVALASTACQATAPDLSDADVAAIRAASATYVQTALTRNWDGWMAVSTDDAVFMPPNQPRLETRQAITEWLGTFPPMPSLTVTPIEILGRADLAFVRGTFTFTLAPEGAAAITDSGNYIEIWRRGADGSWRISRDIWNSERPVAQ